MVSSMVTMQSQSWKPCGCF